MLREQLGADAVTDAPVLMVENRIAMELWNLVHDQVMQIGKVLVLNLAAVVPVIALYGLSGDDALEMLHKIKVVHEIMGKK